MNPVIPCSVGNVSIIPGITYSTRKNNILTRLSLSRSSTKPGSSTRRFLLPSFVASGVFPQNKRIFSFYKKSRTSISATETEVAVGEPGSPVADEVSGDSPSNEVGVSEDSPPKSDANPAPAKIRRSRPARKSEMPPVKNEDLIPGATFTGKVKSVQPFGAFIDFGAFTDGLVHVSMLSDSYVKDVASVVSVGQEVKVKLIEVNTETQRISLSMRENADTGKQRKDAPLDTEKAGPGRRNTSKPSPRKDGMRKSTKFVKGQELQGTVKNMTRSGAFISLPEGEEGFLPISEESSDGFESAMGNTSLQVGQEVSVRVLRMTRGSVTLTMKKEEDTAVSDSAVGQGVVHSATNPFQLAFRKNKDIAAFLDEREKVQNEVLQSSTTTTLEEIKGTVNQGETLLDVPDVQGEPESIKLTDDAPSAVKYAEDDISENADEGTKALDGFSTAIVDDESNLVSNVSSPNPVIDGATEKEIEVDSAILAAEADLSTVNPIIEESTQIDVTTSNVNTDSLVEIANENVIESGVDHVVVEEKKESQTSNEKEEIAATVLTDSDAVEPSPDKIGTITESDIASSAPTPQETADENVEAVHENNYSDTSLSGQNGELCPEGSLNEDRKEENDQVPSPESSATEVVQNPVDPKEVEEQTPATENEDSLTSQVEDKEVSNIGAVPGDNDGDTSFSGQNGKLSLEGNLNEDGTEENDQVPSPESSATEVVKNPIDPTEEVEKQTPASEDENSLTSQVEDKEVAIASKQNGNVGAVSEDNDGDTSLNGQNDELSPEGSLNKDRTEETDQVPSPESYATEVVKTPIDPKEVEEQTPVAENEDSLTSQVEDKEVSNIGVVPEDNEGDTSLSGQNGDLSVEDSLNEDGREENDQVPSPESSATEVVKNPIDPTEEVEKQTPASEDENSLTSQVEDKEVAIASKQNGNVGAVSEDNDGDTSLNGQNDELSPEGSLNKDRTEENDQVPSPESYATEVVKTPIDPKEVEEQTPVTENEDFLTSQVEDKEVSNIGAVPEDNEGDTSLSGQNGNLSVEESLNEDGTEENDQVPSPESLATEVVRNSIDDLKEEEQNQTPATQIENSFTSQVEDKEVAIAFKENSSLSISNGQTGNTDSDQGLSKATISPSLVKQLREETGAGMMDCKKALSETGGDIIKAQEFLRKKGLSSAEKKASRVTAEGRIGSYIHDSRIGVLVEVNCETDFVSRGEIFKELVDDIAMQVAACPQVEYLVTEDVPEEIVNKEKEIEMQKEDLLSRPEQIRSKIVEGRIKKRLEELALLEQPYIKSDKVAVKDWVKQTIATIGENIKVKRFVRFNLGEGLEKKSQDFAAEVAAQTAAKQASTPVKEQPAVPEAKETEQKQSTVTVSASLVKQLREETGAGMMDCKKALAETGGDLEKAQEYLRKKGLSTADKKSSRLAAEGRIGSYIHDSRIGVLIEVNCETDFVGRSEKFKELVDDLAMQVVASPQVQFVSIEDIPEAIVNKEKELEMQREDLLSKPEKIREKIVEGRVSKRLGELVLLEQPFIKDDSVLVKDLVKQSVAAIGENIKVRRFIRFTLGETVEKEATIPA